MFFAPSKLRKRAEIWHMGVSKTSEYIPIRSQMPNLSQEPPMSFKARNQDYKDIDVLCVFKIKIVKIQNMVLSKTSDHIQIKISMPNHSQESPAPSKAPNDDLKDMDVLCTFKIKIESQKLDQGYSRDQGPYTNQDQDAKPQSGTSSVLQSSK